MTIGSADERPSDGLSFDDVTKFFSTVKEGYATVQQIGQKIATMTADDRCVLGVQVNLGLADSDPNAWIGPVNTGIKITSLPEWIDVCSDFGGGAQTVLHGYANLALQSPAQWQGVASSDPGSFAAGTPFQALSGAQQRLYIANALAIGLAQNVGKLASYKPLYEGLQETQRTLGWLDPNTPLGQAAKLSGGVDVASGTPVYIGLDDIKSALARLSGAGGLAAELANQALYGAYTSIPGSGEVTVSIDPLPSAGDLEACLLIGNYGERETCVINTLKANPEQAELWLASVDPWKAVADPTKKYQRRLAPDGRKYVILKPFKTQYGFRQSRFVAGLSLAGIGVGTVVGGVIYKRLKKKKKGRRR